MGLPLVLLESNGLPFLKALDLETGEVRLVGSPADEIAMRYWHPGPEFHASGIVVGGWKIAHDLSGEATYVGQLGELVEEPPDVPDFIAASGGKVLTGTATELAVAAADGRRVAFELPEGCEDWPLAYKWSVAPGGRFIKADMWKGPVVVVDTDSGELIVLRDPAPEREGHHSSSLWTAADSVIVVRNDQALLFDLPTGDVAVFDVAPGLGVERSLALGLDHFGPINELPAVVYADTYKRPPATLDEAWEDFETRLGLVDDDELEERARDSAKPALHLVRDLAKPVGSLGSSRFGGVPDAPDGFEWPTDEGRRTPFFGQIDLAEAAGILDSSFPDVGHLLIFVRDANPEAGNDMGSVDTIYIPASADLTPQLWPDDLPEAQRHPEVPMRLEPHITVQNSFSVFEFTTCTCGGRCHRPFPVNRRHQLLGHHQIHDDSTELGLTIEADQWIGLMWVDGGRTHLLAKDISEAMPDLRKTYTYMEYG